MSANNHNLRQRLEIIANELKSLKDEFPAEFDLLLIAAVQDRETGKVFDEICLNSFEESDKLFEIANAISDKAEDVVIQEMYACLVNEGRGIMVVCDNPDKTDPDNPRLHQFKLYKVAAMVQLKGVNYYKLEGHYRESDNKLALYKASCFIMQLSPTYLS